MMNQTINLPEDFHLKGIFALAVRSISEKAQGVMFILVASLLVCTILAINAIWALTGSPETVISAWMIKLAPLETWLVTFSLYFAMVFGIGVFSGRRAIWILILMLSAWLMGTYIIRSAQPYIPYPEASIPFVTMGDAFGAIIYRLSFLAPAILLIAIYLLVEKRDPAYPLRFGDLKRCTRVFRSKGKQNSWWVWLIRIWLLIALPLFLMFQFQSGFEAVTSGKILIFLVPILVLALLNAFAEDLILQGFILPNESKILSPGIAILLHGLFFGMLHWGSAPTAIAGLPQGLVIGMLVWIAAKATLETGGLGYSILVHMSIDVAIFSGNFI